MNYRIAWKYKERETAGHGEYCIASLQTAEDMARLMNTRCPEINHWVEAEEEPPASGEAVEESEAA
jgi:hypothetical protein